MALLVASFTGSAWAGPFGLNEQITNFTFDDVPINTEPPQTADDLPFPTVDPVPQDIVYAVAPSATGTIRVNDAGTMTKAAVMTTADAGTGVSYIDTQMLVPTTHQRGVLDFDLAILDTPDATLPQAVPGATAGQAFVIQTFSMTPPNRVFRFVAAPTPLGLTDGQFMLRSQLPTGDLIPIPGGTYNDGETHHIRIDIDFKSQIVHAYIDGALTPNLTVPFVEPFGGISEFFIFQNGAAGDPNVAAWDNFFFFVPEPGSLSALALAGLMMVRRRRTA
jgi:hypothetical protein